ncbi:MAG: hypothetical protein GY710_25630 [Desulfobacteraceae bacterium]|nr:hypothetical protein [Desulfobacteraceae bacterium]
MKTRYLNIELKNEIEKNLRTFVKTKMEKSLPGKELKVIIRQVKNSLKKNVRIKFPHDEMKILEKYELTTTDNKIKFIISKGDHLIYPLYSQKDNALCILFETPIVTPYCRYANKNKYFFEIIKENKKLKELCITAFKIHQHIKCEINETVNAYMSSVNKFRTVSTLLSKHPMLKKFIPKEKPPAPVQPSRADKIIKQFETA